MNSTEFCGALNPDDSRLRCTLPLGHPVPISIGDDDGEERWVDHWDTANGFWVESESHFCPLCHHPRGYHRPSKDAPNHDSGCSMPLDSSGGVLTRNTEYRGTCHCGESQAHREMRLRAAFRAIKTQFDPTASEYSIAAASVLLEGIRE